MARHSLWMVLYSYIKSFWCTASGNHLPPQPGTERPPALCPMCHCNTKERENLGEVKQRTPQRVTLTLNKACYTALTISPDLLPPFLVRSVSALIMSFQPQEPSHLIFGLGSQAGHDNSGLINLGTHLIPYFHPCNHTHCQVQYEVGLSQWPPIIITVDYSFIHCLCHLSIAIIQK